MLAALRENIWSKWNAYLWALVGLYYALSAMRLAAGEDSCTALAESGFWQNDTWHPSSCSMGDYDTTHVADCFHDAQITFIGDSTVRQIFNAVAEMLGPDFHPAHDKHQALQTAQGIKNVKVDFHWDAFLNSSTARSLAENWAGSTGGPGLLFAGAGLWYPGRFETPVEDFERQVSSLFDNSTMGTTSKTNMSRDRTHLYINPILPTEQERVKKIPDSKRRKLLPETEAGLNRALKRIFPTTEGMKGIDNSPYTVMWAFNEQVETNVNAYAKDGIHASDATARRKAEMLLNHYCSKKLAAMNRLPQGSTCCLRGRNFAIGQYIVLSVSILLILSALYSQIRLRTTTDRDDAHGSGELKTSKIIASSAVLSIACLAAFWCDRTDALGKMIKAHNQTEFLAFSALALTVPAALTISRTVQAVPELPTSGTKGESPLRDQEPLSRHQTDEWKGWMQVLILIYHWTGASKILWIYRIIRLLVAAYLFMTGYGNTMYYLQYADYRPWRLVQQLLRLNLLSLWLSYTLNTSYISYYFAPLVSFWIVVIYCTMAIARHSNANIYIFTTKIIIAGLSLTVMVGIEGILDWIFSMVELIFNVQWDVKQARFRLGLDLYVVFFGMLVAKILWSRQTKKQLENGIRTTVPSRLVLALFSVVSLAVIASWAIFAHFCTSKPSYNRWHPYVSPLVIIAFAFLRNSCRLARTRYSTAMARLGRCSLETFTLQFHLYLANDTHATLTLGLENRYGHHAWVRYTQAVIILLCFLFLSEQVAHATSSITAWAVPLSKTTASLSSYESVPVSELERESLPEKWEEESEDGTNPSWPSSFVSAVLGSQCLLLSVIALAMFTLNWAAYS